MEHQSRYAGYPLPTPKKTLKPRTKKITMHNSSVMQRNHSLITQCKSSLLPTSWKKSLKRKDNNTRDGEPNIGEFQFRNLLKPKHSERIVLCNITDGNEHMQNENSL